MITGGLRPPLNFTLMALMNFDNRRSYNTVVDTDVRYAGEALEGVTSLRDIIDNVIVGMQAEITRLTAKVAELEAGVTQMSAGDIPAQSKLFDLNDQSGTLISSLQGTPVSYNIKGAPSGKQVKVEFDMKEALSGLPSGYVPVLIDTSVRTYDTKNRIIAASSSKTGELVFDNPGVPVVIQSKVNVKTAAGDIVMQKAYYKTDLTGNEALTGDLDVTSSGSSREGTVNQKEYNEILASNMSNLIATVDAMKKEIDTVKASTK